MKHPFFLSDGKSLPKNRVQGESHPARGSFYVSQALRTLGEMALTACGEVFGREDTGELLNESGVAERT